ncbi:MAG: ACT domain-containing protein [Rhodothermales bacterium]
MTLRLREHPGRFAVARFDPEDAEAVQRTLALVRSTESFWSITRTPDEVSLICPDYCVPRDLSAERGWTLFGVEGPLDFGMTGVAAQLTTPLADAGVSVLVVATHDTDYVLVKADRREEAIQAWQQAQVEVSARMPT